MSTEPKIVEPEKEIMSTEPKIVEPKNEEGCLIMIEIQEIMSTEPKIVEPKYEGGSIRIEIQEFIPNVRWGFHFTVLCIVWMLARI